MERPAAATRTVASTRTGQDGRIGDGKHGRAVDQHDVGVVGQGGQNSAVRAPERSSDGLGGIWPEAKIWRPSSPGTGCSASRKVASPRSTDVKPTWFDMLKNSWSRGPAEVAADHHDTLAGLGDGDGHVGQGRRLPFGRARAGELDRLDGAVQPEELNGGAQAPVGLGGNGTRGGPAHQILRMGSRQSTISGIRLDTGYVAGHEFEVLLGADPVIEELEHQGQPHTEDDAQEAGQNGVLRRLGLDRLGRARCAALTTCPHR